MLLPQFFLVFPPGTGGLHHAVHVGLLVVPAQGQDLLLGQHVAFLEGFLQIAHTGQGIIGVVIPVRDEPAAASDR